MEHAFGLAIPQSLEDACDPSRMALIVYDMQVGICGQLPDGAAVVSQIGRVLQAARAVGMRVFFTRHMALPRELMGASQFRMAMAWQKVPDPSRVKDGLLRDAPGSQLVPELAPLPSEGVFEKITMSAFEGTPFPIALRDCGITAFAIVGIAMEVGIEPTVRHAADLGFIPVVVADACGALDHAAAKRSLDSLAFAGNAVLTDVNSFTGLLANQPDRGAMPRAAAG